MTTSRSPGARSAAAQQRRRRLSLEEVEKRVLATARELLISETRGLTVSLEHINLEVIIAEAGVPRSSAHRRWPTKDAFVADFLCDLASSNSFGSTMDSETVRIGVRVIQDHVELLASEDGRRELLREAVRLGVRRDFEALGDSGEWHTYVALTATVMSIEDETTRNKIRERLRETEAAFITAMATFYDGMAAVLGFRPRAPFTFRHLAAAGGAVIEGLSLRRIVNLELVNEPLSVPNLTGVDPAEWTLAAAAFLAVLEAMIEIVPDHPAMDEHQRAAFAEADTDKIVAQIIGEAMV